MCKDADANAEARYSVKKSCNHFQDGSSNCDTIYPFISYSISTKWSKLNCCETETKRGTDETLSRASLSLLIQTTLKLGVGALLPIKRKSDVKRLRIYNNIGVRSKKMPQDGYWFQFVETGTCGTVSFLFTRIFHRASRVSTLLDRGSYPVDMSKLPDESLIFSISDEIKKGDKGNCWVKNAGGFCLSSILINANPIHHNHTNLNFDVSPTPKEEACQRKTVYKSIWGKYLYHDQSEGWVCE